MGAQPAVPVAETGSVTFVQRYGGGLNLNVHYHLIGIDGWFQRAANGDLTFVKAPTPTQREVEALVLDVQVRVTRILQREGLVVPDGHYQLTLKTPWRDGTTHLRFEPIELMERLAAQIPKPRANLVLYAGVLVPKAKLRAEVVGFARTPGEKSEREPVPRSRAERETWSELLGAPGLGGAWTAGGRRPLSAAVLAGGGRELAVGAPLCDGTERPTIAPGGRGAFAVGCGGSTCPI